MRMPNPTIRALMVSIAFFAVCVTAIREEAHPRTQFIFNGSLPMLSGLLLGVLLSPRSDRGRRFLIGFQVFGWVAVLALSACYIYFPTFARLCFSYGYLRPAQLVGGLPRWPRVDSLSFLGVVFHRPDYRLGLLYLLHTIAVTGPELAIALLGGFFFAFNGRSARSKVT
jgi:hypothetical protein